MSPVLLLQKKASKNQSNGRCRALIWKLTMTLTSSLLVNRSPCCCCPMPKEAPRRSRVPWFAPHERLRNLRGGASSGSRRSPESRRRPRARAPDAHNLPQGKPHAVLLLGPVLWRSGGGGGGGGSGQASSGRGDTRTGKAPRPETRDGSAGESGRRRRWAWCRRRANPSALNPEPQTLLPDSFPLNFRP